jgi:hypothetical protein
VLLGVDDTSEATETRDVQPKENPEFNFRNQGVSSNLFYITSRAYFILKQPPKASHPMDCSLIIARLNLLRGSLMGKSWHIISLS